MASWVYSEHDGKKRQGDRAPVRCTWYHSIARSIARCAFPRLWTTAESDVTFVTCPARVVWCVRDEGQGLLPDSMGGAFAVLR